MTELLYKNWLVITDYHRLLEPISSAKGMLFVRQIFLYPASVVEVLNAQGKKYCLLRRRGLVVSPPALEEPSDAALCAGRK